MPAAIARRRLLTAALAAAVAQTCAGPGQAAVSFAQWVESFRPRARARGVSDETYTRVMGQLRPDTSVYALDRSQPENAGPPAKHRAVGFDLALGSRAGVGRGPACGRGLLHGVCGDAPALCDTAGRIAS